MVQGLEMARDSGFRFHGRFRGPRPRGVQGFRVSRSQGSGFSGIWRLRLK